MASDPKNIDEILCEAVDIESTLERSQFLDEVCGDDEELRRQVDSLIEHHFTVDLFLEPLVHREHGRVDHAPLADDLSGHLKETPPPKSPLGGTLGDFRIIREIGRGGMGVVYEAEQISLKRRVALKVLPFAAVLDPRQLKRFETEAKAAAGLHHGNIVPVIHFGSEQAVHFYAMQYIEGQDVAELIGQLRQLADVDGGNLPETQLPEFELASSIASGQFAPPEPTRRLAPLAVADDSHSPDQPVTPKSKSAVETRPLAELSTKGSTSKPEYFRTIAGLGIQAAEALEYAHENGILHRDIKPSNLMLDGKGKLWITDFGLARVEGDAGLTMTGDVMGTLRYMSPEQALGQRDNVDGRSDVYSLGVTLYEMLTLMPIYPAVDRNELLHKRSHEEPAPLRQVNKEVPVDLETVVLKAISTEPEDRYATAQEFADDLRRFLNHEPIRAKRPSAVNRVGKWIWRHRSLSAALLILAICGPLVGHSLFTLLSAETPPEGVENQVTNSVLPISPATGKYLPGLVPEPTALSIIGRWQITTKAPRGVLKSGVWSPNEKLIALGEAGNVRIYDASNLRLLNVLVGHKQHVTSIDWHPDGERLASASWDGTVRLWTTEGVPTHELKGHTGEVYQVQWRSDGQQLASCGSDGTVRLWNADGTSSRVLESHRNHVFCLDWNPDGGLLASGGGEIGTPDADGNSGDTAIRVWDVANGDLRAKFEGHNFSVLALDWHPDGQQLAAGEGDTFRMGQGVDVSPARHGVRLWNLDGSAGPVPDGEYGSIHDVAWTSDGARLAFGGRQGVVHVWDAEQQVATKLTPESAGASRFDLYSIVWKSDGSQLLTADRRSLRFYDADGTPGLVLESLPSTQFTYVAWSPDGKQISSAGQLWQADGTPVKQNETDDGWTKFVARNIDRHPTDGRIAQVVRDQVTVQSSTGEILWKYTAEGDPKAYFRAAKWSPDGKRLVTASVNDHAVCIWSEDGKLIAKRTDHRGGVESVAWSPDSQWLVSAGGATVRLWTPEGNPGPIIKGHSDEVYDVAWSPDGRWLASAGTDAAIRLWKPDGSKGPELRGHHGGIHGIAWSPDSKRIASANWLDSTLRVWDVKSGNTAWQVLRIGDDETITLSPSGMVLHGDWNRLKRSLLYLVEKHDSSMEILDFVEFQQEFGETLLTHSLQLGKSLLEQKKYNEADDIYDSLLLLQHNDDPQFVSELAEKLSSEFGDVYENLGNHKRAGKVYSDTIAIARSLVEKFPDNQSYQTSLSQNLSERSYSHYQQHQFDKSLADASEAIELDPTSSSPHNNCGLAYYGLKRYEDALAEFNKAIEIKPNNGTQLNNRGVTYIKLKQYDKALLDLDKGIALDPSNSFARNERGGVYRYLKQYQNALDDFNKVIEIAPKNALLYVNRGLIYFELDQHQAAWDNFNNAVELNPEADLSLYYRGRAAFELKQYQAAVTDFSKALEVDPDDSHYSFHRGRVYLQLGQNDKALADFTQARGLAPTQPTIWYMEASMTLVVDDLTAYRGVAAAMLQQFGETSDPQAAYWTAWVCILAAHAVADPASPLQLAEKASQSDPQSQKYHGTAGIALYRAGRFEEARARLADVAAHREANEVLASDPSPAYTYFFLAMTHHQLGHAVSAQQWLDKGIHWVEHDEKRPISPNRQITLKRFQAEAEQILKTAPPPKKEAQPTAEPKNP